MRSILTAQYPYSSNKIIKKFLQKVLTTCKMHDNMNILRKTNEQKESIYYEQYTTREKGKEYFNQQKAKEECFN